MSKSHPSKKHLNIDDSEVIYFDKLYFFKTASIILITIEKDHKKELKKKNLTYEHKQKS